MYVVHHVLSGVHRGQRRTLGSLELVLGNWNCEPPCGCWQPNQDALEKQQVLSTAHLSLQPSVFYLFCWLVTPGYASYFFELGSPAWILLAKQRSVLDRGAALQWTCKCLDSFFASDPLLLTLSSYLAPNVSNTKLEEL